jgi:hypothetical protein
MWKKLRIKEGYNHHYEYTKDIDRIVKIFEDRGYEITIQDAVKSWEMVSEDLWAAGWLSLYEGDDEIFQDCFRYLEEV